MSEQKVIATIRLPERNDDTRVNLSDDISFQWLYDGRAYLIEVRSSKRETVDLYIDVSLQLVREWDRRLPFHSLQDISYENFQMTPHLRGRLDEVLKEMRGSGMDGRSVIVMSDGFTGRIMQVLGRFFAQQAKPIIQDWVVGREVAEKRLADIMAQSNQ